MVVGVCDDEGNGGGIFLEKEVQGQARMRCKFVVAGCSGGAVFDRAHASCWLGALVSGERVISDLLLLRLDCVLLHAVPAYILVRSTECAGRQAPAALAWPLRGSDFT